MRRAIGLEQSEIDRFGDQATELCQWMEHQPSGADGCSTPDASRLTIPPRLTAIAAILVVYGAPIILEGQGADGLCWAGGCHIGV